MLTDTRVWAELLMVQQHGAVFLSEEGGFRRVARRGVDAKQLQESSLLRLHQRRHKPLRQILALAASRIPSTDSAVSPSTSTSISLSSHTPAPIPSSRHSPTRTKCTS
mmetsp:Transcript_14620/g.32832  ORF Transcript_14620/g.32832 Transcript_14620/m.32832 type:complete len:108 (-) Transcript_14620:703-1026(-)